MGTQRSFSVEELHQSNAIAERCWGILLRSVRAILSHAGGDEQQARFWPFLMLGAVQRHNNLYSAHSEPPAIPILTASKGEVAPFPLSKFRVLLCDCYCAINEHEFFDKLSPRRRSRACTSATTRGAEATLFGFLSSSALPPSPTSPL